ncbi:MAG: asparagine synthase (glutamine-hydrolyzing) [bacterium]
MCGICGFTRGEFSLERSSSLLQEMCRLLDYRGPDDEGVYVDDQVALGHRRLSIIDLSPAGHQPMSTAEGALWITFNGEIYNFLELRKELEGRGCRFRTRSDTEVILKAYEIFGENCLQYLNGMFAFAIWDRPRRRLLLARDRLGKKPLYYYHQGERLIFASEMKAILALPEVPREIDMAAMNFYLTYGYVPAPMSIFKHIRKVQEAGYLVYQSGRIDERVYWELPQPEQLNGNQERAHTEEEYAQELEALLADAVRCRMISDVPLGAFLSGGLDSSAIVAMMAKCSNQPVRTFTIDFAEKTFSEVDDARAVADHCGTQHQILQVATDAINLLPELVWHFDEPFADSSAIPTYYVSKMARERVTVILSGDGGDELFAGYSSYLKKDEHSNWLRLPAGLRRVAFGNLARALPIQAPARNFLKYVGDASPDDGPLALGLFPYIKDDILAAPVRQELRKYDATAPRQDVLAKFVAPDKLTRLQLADMKLYLPGDILVKVDRMSMAHSLETRAPLLDYRLVEFAVRLPVSLKMREGVSKYLLRKVLYRHLPKATLAKKKQGFAVPINQWFRRELSGFAREVLLDERCRRRGLFKPEVVQRVLKFHIQGRRDFGEWIWMLLNLELWFQTYVDAATRRI